MKIAICGSINFTYEIKEIADKLKEKGFEVGIPITSQKILNGDISLEDFKKEKEANGDASFRKIQDDVIKRYYELIKGVDAILIANYEKHDIKDYVGGNTFLEMGFAYVLNKKIFLLNSIPEMTYTDEIKAMLPIALNGDLNLINQ